MKLKLLISSFILITISCEKDTPDSVDPAVEPFEFKSSGTVVCGFDNKYLGVSVEFIDGGGNIDHQMILASSWSTSFIGSKGDSVRLTVDSLYTGYSPEDSATVSIRYQGKLIFSKTGGMPVTAGGVLP